MVPVVSIAALLGGGGGVRWTGLSAAVLQVNKLLSTEAHLGQGSPVPNCPQVHGRCLPVAQRTLLGA
jgi:hypothetical protein